MFRISNTLSDNSRALDIIVACENNLSNDETKMAVVYGI